MAEQTLVSDIIAAARARTDTETPTPTADHVSDDYLTLVVARGYKRLRDMILQMSGKAGISLLAVKADLAAGVTTLPDNVYRVIDVRRKTGDDRWAPLPTVNWRNRHNSGSSDWPTYTVLTTIEGNSLLFDPPTANPGPLQVWYISDALGGLALSPSDMILTINGWDEWLIGYVAVEICVKEDRPTGDHRDLMKDAEARIRVACQNLRMGHTETLARVEVYAEDALDWY